MEAIRAPQSRLESDLDGTHRPRQADRAMRWVVFRVSHSLAPECLSPRELDVLALVATGKTDVEIAGRLSISPRTVGAHVSNMLNKTGLTNRVELVIWAVAFEVVGLVPQSW